MAKRALKMTSVQASLCENEECLKSLAIRIKFWSFNPKQKSSFVPFVIAPAVRLRRLHYTPFCGSWSTEEFLLIPPLSIQMSTSKEVKGQFHFGWHLDRLRASCTTVCNRLSILKCKFVEKRLHKTDELLQGPYNFLLGIVGKLSSNWVYGLIYFCLALLSFSAPSA